MKLPKYTQFHCFSIWEPRWRDRKVLLAKHKVGDHNKIVFSGNPATKRNSMGDKPYYVSGTTVKKFKKESNGSIDCYAVPVSELEPLELINDLQEVI